MTGIYTADIRLWGRGDLSTLGDPDGGCPQTDAHLARKDKETGSRWAKWQGEAAVPEGQSPPSLGCGDTVRTRPREDSGPPRPPP